MKPLTPEGPSQRALGQLGTHCGDPTHTLALGTRRSTRPKVRGSPPFLEEKARTRVLLPGMPPHMPEAPQLTPLGKKVPQSLSPAQASLESPRPSCHLDTSTDHFYLGEAQGGSTSLAPSPLSRVTIQTDPQLARRLPDICRSSHVFTPRVQIVTQPGDSILKTPPPSVPTNGKQMQGRRDTV